MSVNQNSVSLSIYVLQMVAIRRTSGSDSCRVFSWSRIYNCLDKHLQRVLVGEQVDDLKGVLYNLGCHELQFIKTNVFIYVLVIKQKSVSLIVHYISSCLSFSRPTFFPLLRPCIISEFTRRSATGH